MFLTAFHLHHPTVCKSQRQSLCIVLHFMIEAQLTEFHSRTLRVSPSLIRLYASKCKLRLILMGLANLKPTRLIPSSTCLLFLPQ